MNVGVDVLAWRACAAQALVRGLRYGGVAAREGAPAGYARQVV